LQFSKSVPVTSPDAAISGEESKMPFFFQAFKDVPSCISHIELNDQIFPTFL
jgi:hypothetical protein